MECLVDECNKLSKNAGKGMCVMHYKRILRHGKLEPTRIIGDDKSRFMSHVVKSDGCWGWKSYIDPSGYSKFGVKLSGKPMKIMYAHRFSYELVNGQIPEGKIIDHLCRNRSCVNPNHLEAVDTYTNNIRGNLHLKKKSKLPLGVYHHGKKFRTYFSSNGAMRFIGVFETVESASRAYNLAREGR